MGLQFLELHPMSASPDRLLTFADPPALKPTDRLSILEFADIFGFTPAEMISAIGRNRRAVKKAFNSIPELAIRWCCSRAKVYIVLREAEFKLLDLSQPGKDKGKRLIPGHVVERIEESRMRSLPEKAA
jgi:hypothetical protein